MRAAPALSVFIIVGFVGLPAHAVTPDHDLFLRAVQIVPGAPENDLPRMKGFAKANLDTIWFGGHDGNGYAVEGGVWDFESGADPLQGWYGVDLTANSGATWGNRVTSSDFDCPGDAPMINGTTGQLWFGMHGETADRECWVCDAGGDCSDPGSRVGYSNDVCNRADSPPLAYTSGSDVDIAFDYFLDCEGFPFDYVKVQLLAQPSATIVEVANVDNGSGGIIGSPDAPGQFDQRVDDGLIPVGTTTVALRFEFLADSGFSDEDGGGNNCSTYGPFGADNIEITNGATLSADFDSGDEGFTFSHCPGVGNFVDVNPISNYAILDPCQCELTGNVLTMHDQDFQHPDDPDGSGGGQVNYAVSPIIDRRAYPATAGFGDVFLKTDFYAWLPMENGVLIRPGVSYYPWRCPESGADGWSPRQGQVNWFATGTDPVCFEWLNNFTEDGIPGTADFYRIILEIKSCCACFSIQNCTGITNETPLFDNIRLGLTGANAPIVSLGSGGFQDVYAADGSLNPGSTGISNDASTGSGSQDPPYMLSDSLSVVGPVVSGDVDPWEVFLWFRLARKGPMQDQTEYLAWKSRLQGDPETEFVGVRMDSSQVGGNGFSNKFCSFAHEDDPYFNSGFGDLSEENEILPDDVFTPGTQIQYFIASNFVGQADKFFLPDTAGGRFFEYEILPGMRWSGEPDASEIVWPCVLYWDAFNRGAEAIIEPALDLVVPDVPGPGPDHDRYDELLAEATNGASSIYRVGVGANNGATLVQLLGYSMIVLNTGNFSSGAMREADMLGVEDWLLTTICDGSVTRRGFIANGDRVAEIIRDLRPTFLSGVLGGGFDCAPYRAQGCPSGTPEDSSFCVELIASDGAAYPTAAPYWALGNGCPHVRSYSVLFPTDGLGNRDWFDYDGIKGVISFAEIVQDASGGLSNYRSVVDGYSYHFLTSTFDGGLGTCVSDSVGRVAAAAAEMSSALGWIFDGDVAGFCVDPCGTDAVPLPPGRPGVDRLYQNEPNPFNPRTTIRFSVAGPGMTELSIYDIAGRLVHSWAFEKLDPGSHTVVWDGTDGRGHSLASGIYWSQLRTKDYVSNKKMMLLK